MQVETNARLEMSKVIAIVVLCGWYACVAAGCAGTDDDSAREWNAPPGVSDESVEDSDIPGTSSALERTQAADEIEPRGTLPDSDKSAPEIRPDACELVADETLGKLEDVRSVGGPSLAVDASGHPRVAWVGHGADSIRVAEHDSDGWSVDREFGEDESVEFIRNVALAARGGGSGLLVEYGRNLPDLGLFTRADGDWSAARRFANDTLQATTLQVRPSSIRLGADGRLHALVGLQEGRSEYSLTYLYGTSDELHERELFRTDGYLNTLAMARGADGSVDVFYKEPPTRDEGRSYSAVGEPAGSPETFDALSNREGLGAIYDYALDGVETPHVLANEEGLSVLRRESNGSWSDLRVAEGTDGDWRSDCPGDGWDPDAVDELDGTTCQIDHVFHPERQNALLTHGGEVWVAQIRKEITGTATWECRSEEERAGCQPYCQRKPDLKRSSKLVFGRVGGESIDLEPTDFGLPREAFRTMQIGPKGAVHFTYADRVDQTRVRRIRYGRIRCR